MEKFFSLSKEKQKAIIDAGLQAFGKSGYKKASASDIAKAAGISKGMIFHYFGSKKLMYLYLVNVSFQELTESFKEKYNEHITDFFDRILLGTEIKLDVIRKYPALLNFLTSVYFETDAEVSKEIKAILKQGEVFRKDFALTNLDVDKFKDNINPELVLNILVKFTEGYIGSITIDDNFDLDGMIKEFKDCIELMKNNFYKEEYL